MEMAERRNAITELINRKGSVSFAQIKKAFPDVSDMTLRTDLKSLDQDRKIIRIHGGARSVEYVVGADGLQVNPERRMRNAASKEVVAKKAIDLIRPNATIFIDSGTTCEELCTNIAGMPLQIFTCSLSNAIALARSPKSNVFVIGGRMSPFTLNLNGSHTLTMLQQISFDQAFLGVTAYQSEAGFTCGSDEEASIKQQVAKNAGQVIALMDSSKVDKRTTFKAVDLDDIDLVVGDDEMPDEFKLECSRTGVEVI